MPATSIAQQQAAGAELERRRQGQKASFAPGMTMKQLTEYASTKQAGLPQRAGTRRVAEKIASVRKSRRKSAPAAQRHVAAQMSAMGVRR